MTPSVSIIIPAYNDPDGLERCLQALSIQDYPAQQFEVLVVDNGSQQSLESVAKAFPFVRFLREETPGSYAARNTALSQARGAIIAFTDADCVPDPDWVRCGASYFNDVTALRVVGGRIPLFASKHNAPTWIESYELALGFPQQANIEQAHYSVTANLFTNKATLDKVGPFDAQLLSGGDKDWGQRAHRAGVQMLYADDVAVRHPARSSWSALSKKRRRHIGGFVARARTKYPAPVAYGVVFSKAMLPPVKRLLLTRTEPGSGTVERAQLYARVWCVASALQLLSAKEVVRLALGGERTR